MAKEEKHISFRGTTVPRNRANRPAKSGLQRLTVAGGYRLVAAKAAVPAVENGVREIEALRIDAGRGAVN